MLLGTHPQVLPVGELNQLPKNIALNSVCSCGAHIRDCSFWAPVVKTLGTELAVDLWSDPYALDLGKIQAGVEIDRARQTKPYLAVRALERGWVEVCRRAGCDLRTTPLISGFRSSVANIQRLHALLRSHAGAQLIVDSNKDFRQSVLHYMLAPSETRMILLVRDGRGVMASYMRTGRTNVEAVDHWKRYYERALPWLENHVHPDHLVKVRYEDLMADPDKEVGRVLRVLGLDPVTGVAHKVTHKAHIVNGNKMFLKPISGLQGDDRWRTELSAADLDYFRKEALPLSLRLGYSEAELV